ncbi:Zinc finger protein 45 [Schistosoma japonicum]|nr:Zinc finger protein 45 [Schistosoma japonicum]
MISYFPVFLLSSLNHILSVIIILLLRKQFNKKYTTSSYFLNSKPTDQMLVSTSAGVHMNKCLYSENKPSSTLMNVENSQHTVDSSVHSNISSSNTSTSVNTMNTGNEDADVTMCICPVCGFSASSPRRQDEHMELIHGEVVCNIMTSVTTNPILSVTTENSNSSPLMKSNKYDWPIEMNNSTFDLLQHPSQQTHLPLCNPLTLQASSTPQRNKLWSTDEQINSLLTITEQMQVNKKSDVVYNKIYTTTRTTDTTLNLKLSSPFTNIGTTTTTSVTNTNNSSTEIFNKLKTSQCNICPTTFPWHGDLTEHLRSVHGMQKSRENARNGKAGSFCCSHCKYVAKYQSELNRHMRLHWGVKPFICVFCPYRSAWKGDLKRHMESHHRERFTCETELIKIMSQFKNNAGTRTSSSSSSTDNSSNDYENTMNPITKSYTHEQSLKSTYEQNNVNIDNNITDNYNYHSNIINVTNTTQSNLIENYLPQTNLPISLSINNENHLICTICSYHAQNQSKFKNHMASHINLKQFKCPICGQRSNYKWDITKHMKKQHPYCSQLPITIINDKETIIDEHYNPVLLTNTLHSGSLSKCSLDDNHYPVYPLSSNELNNSIYSGVCLTSTTTTNATTTTMESKVNYPIVTYSLQKNTTNSFNNSNVSVISPYTIGSLISDPLKGNNTTTNPAINLLFNIQQQVLMSGLLQTWQQQQNQKYQELHQKDQTMHNNTCSGIVSYSDAVINMTSPSITKISSLCSPSSYATQTITPSTAIPNNTQYNTMFKPIGNHQLTGSPIVTTTQSPVDINLNTDVLKTNKINDTNSMNWVETQFTSEWSIPTNLDSINTVDKQSQSHRPHQQHQLQMNRFFAPGRRRESHRLVTRTNIGRKSAPMTTSLFNRHVNSPGTVSNTNNNTANCKEEQWKRFQCSGCGHRSNWKWDINKHIKVAHPERTNIVTITLDLEDAKNTYNEYMNRLKLSRNRYLSETIPDISTNSNSLTGTGLTGNTGEGYYRPFKCSVCGHRSNWKWDVGKHIKQIHNGNGEVQTLSLDEARRTIHQYKNRRRQHHRHSDLTIKCEPSFCSSSESNVNLSPVSLTVGEGNVDLPVSISSSSSSASCSSISSSSTRMLNTKNDEVKNHDTTNNFYQINQYSLFSEYCPLNLSIDNSMISENFLELKKSPQTMITSQSSIPLNKYRLQLKFKCKFCTMKLNSWKSIIFHTYSKHYQQLLHHHHHHHHTSGNIDNHYLIKWLSLRRQIVHNVNYVNSNYHSCCYGNKMNQNIHLLNRKKFKCTEITCAELDQFSIGKSIHSLQDNNNCDSSINDKQSNPSSLTSSRSIATQRKLKEFTNFAHLNDSESTKINSLFNQSNNNHQRKKLTSGTIVQLANLLDEVLNLFKSQLNMNQSECRTNLMKHHQQPEDDKKNQEIRSDKHIDESTCYDSISKIVKHPEIEKLYFFVLFFLLLTQVLFFLSRLCFVTIKKKRRKNNRINFFVYFVFLFFSFF